MRSQPFLLAKAEIRLRNNESVSFGSLHLCPTGLRKGKDTIEWQDIEKLGILTLVGTNFLQIRRLGKRRDWYRTPVFSFPNLDVFMILVGPILLGENGHAPSRLIQTGKRVITD